MHATALGLYELCRQVAGRCAAASHGERRRVIAALERASNEDRALRPDERERVRQKYRAAREKLRGPAVASSREAGRTRLMEFLEELERRLGLKPEESRDQPPAAQQELYDPEAPAEGAEGAPPPGEQQVEWVEGCYPWTRVRDQDGQVYYFNEETAESTWERPQPARD